eukprot:CAMPEP_0201282816 /NCGR_PEP_ID=MMETSP1317-20130820/6765_1 /ASSEMBLY_ACC=CAM_ASM_000770 /TAXON_ID=187299 /ORGANISM="Undescribed Undescribed, Strain Undescribed" /LENGTH=776 /DNA_ID=CAMNT_0047596837 /DNA_START=3454 /DNA_END=5784 /DNA_ORIENTATION=-
MTNKDLLNKLTEMDVSVKSHMSSIDESIVDEINDGLKGARQVTLVETRVKPTVIRRRKKVTEKKKTLPPKTEDEKPDIDKKTKEEKKLEIKVVKAVKAKKEPSAKIIKLPEPLEKLKAPKKTPTLSKPIDSPSAEEKKKNALSLKKKKTFKRKKIVEGADLRSDFTPNKKRKRAGKKKKIRGQKTQITTPKAIKRRIKMNDTIVLSELAKRMGIKASEVIKKMITLRVMATVNQTIDFSTAVLVASEFNFEVEKFSSEEEAILTTEKDDPAKLLERSPIITIMGHVDHGKTSLLDVIHKTKVTETEAGGITQHIGAYNVKIKNGRITFLDTPGHEAFTSMRARGAGITDIVVLVVAADDGVMPQTIEAINHSKAAKVPIIVAVNKIDKPNANPELVLRELANHGVVTEDWGGDTIFVKISAKQNKGIDELLDMILLQAEILELKANPDKLAKGYVVETRLDSGRGPTATVLINEGTLKTGDFIVCGIHYGRVRAMIDAFGMHMDSAGPSIPVEVLGLSGVPVAGDELVVTSNEKSAKQIGTYRSQKQRFVDLSKSNKINLEALFEKVQKGEVKELNLIIKADVHGSIEALKDSLSKLSTDEIKINIVHSAAGTITESDLFLATVSNAIIIGFNVRPSASIQKLAEDENVDMRFYDVIYNAINDTKNAIIGMIAPTFKEQILGRAEVRKVFYIQKVGAIAGSYVTDGKIEHKRLIRLLRDGIIQYNGKILSLKHFQEDVNEVQSGYECGIGIEKYNDVKAGDTIECYSLEEIKPKLD